MRCASLRLRCVYHEDEIPKYLCSVLACSGPTRSLGISVLGGVPGCSHTPRYEQCHKNYVFSLPSVGTRRRTVAAPQARPSDPATTYSSCSNKCYSSIYLYSTSLFQHSSQVRHLDCAQMVIMPPRDGIINNILLLQVWEMPVKESVLHISLASYHNACSYRTRYLTIIARYFEPLELSRYCMYRQV